MLLDHEAREVCQVFRDAMLTFFNLKHHDIGVCIVENDITTCRDYSSQVCQNLNAKSRGTIELQSKETHLRDDIERPSSHAASAFINDGYQLRPFQIDIEMKAWFVQDRKTNTAEEFLQFRK